MNLLESLRWIQRRYAGVGRKTLTFGRSEINYAFRRKGMLAKLLIVIKNIIHFSSNMFYRFMQEFFEKCEHLLVLDPLLLRVLIFICPDKELASLFEKIPPYLSTTWLAYKAFHAYTMNKPEASECILCCCEWTAEITSYACVYYTSSGSRMDGLVGAH